LTRLWISLAGALASLLIAAPNALAEQPRFLKSPDVDILINGKDHVDTPPSIPFVGDTLWGNNGSPDCNPPCDPNDPSQIPQPFQVLLPGNGEPPPGQFYSWRRCNDTGCFDVQGKSATANTYVIQAADAGSKLQLVVWLTNYDCGEVVREGPDKGRQECRYSTTKATALTETVAQAVTVAITPAALAEGVAGTPYSQKLASSGGTGPYAYSLASGTLPPGVTLSSAGALGGTPTTAGSYTFTVRSTASGASPGTRTYTVVVHLGLPATLGNGTTGVSYTQALSAAGATGAIAYSVGAGALPDGLSISGTQIVGTPTKQGAFTFTVHAADAAGGSGDQQYTVQIAYPTVAIGPDALPEVIRDQRYLASFSATGGTGPYRFFLADGELPARFHLLADGTLTGRPIEDGTSVFRITIGVTDKYGAPATKEYELAYYGPTITLRPAKVKPLKLDTKVRVRFRAAGGTKPYTFEIARGLLPDGLGLGERGLLLGTPTEIGTFRVTVRVTDGKGATETFLTMLVVRG
jgi:hypothetical protein